MKVAQYTFQSPSSSPVQVGRLDPSSVEKESSSPKQKAKPIAAASSKTPEQWLKNDAQQVFKTKPTITPSTIDTYA